MIGLLFLYAAFPMFVFLEVHTLARLDDQWALKG